MTKGKEVVTTFEGSDLPAGIVEDLLGANTEALQLPQQLPRIKVLPGGANMFEFEDTNETTKEVVGIILGFHASHVLWDKPFDEEPVDGEEGPACGSPDGRTGRPREGFLHRILDGQKAIGDESWECAGCPYFQWNTMALVNKSGKGKACTDQRNVYLMLEDRGAPMHLRLSPTSTRPFESYIATLTNHKTPAQFVRTKITLHGVEKGRNKWSVAAFENLGVLDGDEISAVIEERDKWMPSITPQKWETFVDQALGVSGDDKGGDDTPF